MWTALRSSLNPEQSNPPPAWEYRHALVTGATGCIGRSLVRHLAAGGCRIKTLCRNRQEAAKLFARVPAGTIRVIEGDLGNPLALKEATEGVEVIFHAAAKVHSIPRSRQEEEEFFQVNSKGTENLLRASDITSLRAFIFFSTIAVYGPQSSNLLSESALCHPEGAYAQSKFEAEQRVLEATSKNSMSATVLRLSLVYGEGERGNFQRMIRAIARRRFLYVGNKRCLKSMTYVDNVAEAARLASNNPAARGEVFNVADPSPYPMHTIAETVARELQVSIPSFQIPVSLMGMGGGMLEACGRALHFRPPFTQRDIAKLSADTVCDVSKIRGALGFRPPVDLQEGIRRTVQWYQTERSRAGTNS